ncbi:hypothetical protein ACHAPJ_007896 [Fusarium lateritium]
MNSTAFPDQNAPQPGASPANPPKPKAIVLNGSPISTLSNTQDDEQTLLTDKLPNDLVDKKTTTTTNDAMTPDKPLTNSTNNNDKNTINTRTAADDEAPVAKALHFFATASPGSLAGVAVGFAAFTYLTMGRLGLVLIGAFGGVVGFISWEARNPELAKAVRGERGVDVLDRLLEAKNNRAEEKRDDSSDNEEPAMKNFDEFRPETREALGGLVDAVIRDYVKWWYSPIVPTDHSFPLACRKTLTSYLLSVSSHLGRKRPADAFLDLLTNSSSIIIVFMSELASAFAELPPDSSTTAADAIYNYLASNPDCHLANLLNQRQQASKFKMVAEDLLAFLDRNSYNCDPARVFLREILANSVLEKTLHTCSQADWINGWIVYLLEAGEPDLNQAIDVGMQRAPEPSVAATNVFADLDGNVGNIGIAKPGRSSLEKERARRKEPLGHKKKLSKAEEEMDEAMQEMKRMNELIAAEDARRASMSAVREPNTTGNAEKRLSAAAVLSPTPSAHSDKPFPSATSTEGFSTKSDIVQTPITPRSPMDSSSPESSPRRSDGTRFTSFDQIVPPGQVVDDESEEAPKKAPLTLHNATVTLHDDTTGESSRIRSKPNWDYWVQVEPSVTAYPGWMIVRRYADFETLHEILRRIANISGATAFTELHKDLPDWKLHTRESLRGELERYLRDACWYQSLAESEGMKRFLEKSKGHTHSESKQGFGWESMGKGMLDALTTAPKGAMEGGKSIVGGVTGVFGSFPGLGRKSTNQSVDLTNNSSRLSISTPPGQLSGMRSPVRSARDSMDSQRSSIVSLQPGKMPPMERRPSYQSQSESDAELRMSRPERKESASASASALPSREHSRAPSLAQLRSPSAVSLDFTKLPPPPDQIADDYGSPEGHGDMQEKLNDGVKGQQGCKASQQIPTPPPSVTESKRASLKPAKQYTSLSEPETRVAVELLFAVINEMYTLSSAWNIRRTLLTAAKSFLLRPGNPSLLTVQSLIQKSVIDANTSDAGIAHQLRKVRENMMPTEQELAAWPAELTTAEKEKLRIKARRLLIQSGLPAALMGVMGQAATGEALGRVFDCLQIEEVARGLLFGLILQVVRIVTH